MSHPLRVMACSPGRPRRSRLHRHGQAVDAAAGGIRHSHQVAMRSESAGAGRIRRPIRASRPSGLALIFSVHGIFPPLARSLKERKSSPRRGSESASSRPMPLRARRRDWRRIITTSVSVTRGVCRPGHRSLNDISRRSSRLVPWRAEAAGLPVGVAVIEASRAVASRTRAPVPLTHLQPRSHLPPAVGASPKGGERAESLLAERGPVQGATDGQQGPAAGNRPGQRSAAIRPVGPGRLLSGRRPGAGRRRQ